MKTKSICIASMFLLFALVPCRALCDADDAHAPEYIVNSLNEVEQLKTDSMPAAAHSGNSSGTPLRGAMISPDTLSDEHWDTLADWGATLVRYEILFETGGQSPTNHAAYATAWRNGLEKAIGKLETALSQARKRGIKVCIDMHMRPGGSCGRNHGDPPEWRNDNRVFHDPFYADLFIEAWTNIVRRVEPYRDAIYGYDLFNEPRQDTPAAPGCDQVSLFKRAALTIHAIDPKTPVVVMAWKDDPNTLAEYTEAELRPLIHEIHIYQPHDFTHQGILTPLDRVEYWPNPAKGWNAGFLRKWLAQYRDIQNRTGAKFFVGEFSAIAWAPGAETYIRDCIALFEEYGWDWTYHAFHEWPGWSVDCEAMFRDRDHRKGCFRKSASNPRMRMLKRGLAGKIAPEEAGAPCRTRTFRRVMFCGNSLTRHGPNADIGWTNNWGMAASAPERDYVHLLVRALEARSSVRPEFTIQTIPLEQGYDNAEKLSSAIGKAVEWQPDLIVLAYGENAHSVTNDVNEALCRAAYLETTRALRDAGAEVVLRAPFWPSERFRRILSGVAEETGAIYVDIGDLGNREEMTAKGLFKHDGVARHPGDAGMIAIADRILAAIVEHLEAEEDDSVAGRLEPAR